MMFGQRLLELRKDRGLSQEGLADLVGVSRQAVAKWESGAASPEIDKLIALSTCFRISLDRLVRDAEYGDPAPFGLVEGMAEPVVAFLIRAKRACYAGAGGEAAASRPASHDLRHEEGELLYLDSYLGGEKFAGEEAIWRSGQPFWAMNYAGRLTGEGFSGNFLKECLALVPVDRPFRGPDIHRAGDFIYHCRSDGSFDWFVGQEEIFCRGKQVYECRFHGGLVR